MDANNQAAVHYGETKSDCHGQKRDFKYWFVISVAKVEPENKGSAHAHRGVTRRISVLPRAVVCNDLLADPERSRVVVAQFKHIGDELDRHERAKVVDGALPLRKPEEENKSWPVLRYRKSSVSPELPKPDLGRARFGLDRWNEIQGFVKQRFPVKCLRKYDHKERCYRNEPEA